MSNELDKTKRDERIQQKENRLNTQKSIAKLLGGNGRINRSAHFYHKQNVNNCGNARCVLCMNPRKAFNEKTVQERKFEQTENFYE